jgi:hypothetical protein
MSSNCGTCLCSATAPQLPEEYEDREAGRKGVAETEKVDISRKLMGHRFCGRGHTA